MFGCVSSSLLRLNVNRTLNALKTGDLLFVHMPPKHSTPLENAIQELSRRTIDWVKAQGSPVSKKDTSQHVALVVTEGRGLSRKVYCVEAMKGHEVRRVPIDTFLQNFGDSAKFFHGTVRGTEAETREAAAEYALDKLGLAYADDYAPPCKADEFYCSSLVDYAYRHALDEELPFSPEPFELIFEPRTFWEKHYKDLQKPIPSFLGSNPTLLMHSARVRYYETVLGPAAAKAQAEQAEARRNSRKSDLGANIHLQYALQYGLYNMS